MPPLVVLVPSSPASLAAEGAGGQPLAGLGFFLIRANEFAPRRTDAGFFPAFRAVRSAGHGRTSRSRNERSWKAQESPPEGWAQVVLSTVSCSWEWPT